MATANLKLTMLARRVRSILARWFLFRMEIIKFHGACGVMLRETNGKSHIVPPSALSCIVLRRSA
jgi:hypothetical protein